MRKNLIIVAVIAVALAGTYLFELPDFFNIDYFRNLHLENPGVTAGIYFLVYILATALSLPTATLLTLIGGAVFGLVTGVLLVSFASTIGATLAFLASRMLLRDWVQNRFTTRLVDINRGVAKDGGLYLFSLRLIPLFPFWLINLAMGLTTLRISTFFWVSQLGMLPATVVYVNAGAELAAIEQLSVTGILTPGLLVSFILIAALPFLTRALIAYVNRRHVYRPYQRPSHYDANLLVIGGGSAGLVTALIAAAVRAKVILVEKARMGGDCLNTGCVPSKSLIRAARTVKDIREAGNFGIEVGDHTVDFAQVMAKIQNNINTIAPHDSAERYTELGVECVSGQAVLISPWEVRVGKRTIRAKTIVIASGAEPFIPPIPGIENVDYLTCDNLWELREQPRTMLVLGAGPVGCELAQAFQRLGTQVTLVDMMSQVLPREDADVSEFIAGVLKDEGVELLLNCETIGFEDHAGRCVAIFEARDLNAKTEEAGDQRTLAFDKCLVAVGRKATIRGLGLEELGIEITPQGTLAVDDCLRTRFPNILGCGDVVGPYQFTHAASHQGWYAAVNGLFGALKRFRVDYSVMPWTTFTDPEVAHVGLSEKDAKIQNIAYELTQYSLSELDRAIVEGVTTGFLKVLTVPGKDRILGVSIVGAHAGELLTEFVSAMKSKRGLNTILGVIHAYPTFSEANRMVAGIWRRNHPPQNLLNLAARYHRWKLGGNS